MLHRSPREFGRESSLWTLEMAAEVAFEGHNSRLFYLARSVHFRLGTFLLLRELLNKAGRRIPVHIGGTVPYSKLACIANPDALAEHLRSLTYELSYRRMPVDSRRSEV